MLRSLKLVALLLIITTSSATLAQTPTSPQIIEDPGVFAVQLTVSLSRNEIRQAGQAIATAIGRPDMADHIAKSLALLEDKKFDFIRKVVDKEFYGALRQIVYYTYIENFGFIYFRFNFAMTSKGWILKNFFFKDETQDIFPKDLVHPG